jgi:hypothetical protein
MGTYAHPVAGTASKAVKLQGHSATLCSCSARNATASMEPMSVNTCSSKMAKIACLIGTTERCPLRFRNAPAFKSGRFLFTPLVPKEN